MEYEYTTPEMVQSELKLSTPFGDDTSPSTVEVLQWINEASSEINSKGRVYGYTPRTEVFDFNGCNLLLLKHAPIIEVTSIKYSKGKLGSDDYSLTTELTKDKDYTVFKDEGEIEILPSWRPQFGLKRIQIDYNSGFLVVPSHIQALCTKMVSKRALDTQLSRDINEKKSGKSVAVGSIKIVKPADFGVSQYNVLSNDINRMKSELLGGTSVYRLPMNRY